MKQTKHAHWDCVKRKNTNLSRITNQFYHYPALPIQKVDSYSDNCLRNDNTVIENIPWKIKTKPVNIELKK